MLFFIHMATIRLKEISKIYGFGDATTVALEDVDLDIEQGEFVAIMGPSGCGKSTLLNMIGLLDRPSHGSYMLEEKSVEKLSATARAKARRDKIGFVFQHNSLLPKLNVIENVALPLSYKGRLLGRRNKAARKMLDRVAMAEKEYFYPYQLSGGQVQRVAIARALINDPSLIIADEPTGNLDSESSRTVMELLREIHELGNTVLLVTHNPELTRYASRVLYMQDGQNVFDAATSFSGEWRVDESLEALFAAGTNSGLMWLLLKMVARSELVNTRPLITPSAVAKKGAPMIMLTL